MAESSGGRRVIASRIIRPGGKITGSIPDNPSTMGERIEQVWTLTRLCLAWQEGAEGEPRLQRSVSRARRPR